MAADPGTLYLWFPRPDLRASALGTLRSNGRDVESFDGCLRARVTEAALDELVLELGGTMSRDDAQKTRALWLRGEEPPSLDDICGISTLRELDLLARTGWLLAQLERGSITSHFHPIVHTDDTSRVFAHEALLRGLDRDGAPVEPHAVLQLAREAGVLAQLDLAACRATIREVAKLDSNVTVFINVSPAALDDAEKCLRATIAAIDEQQLEHGRFVFEVIEADRIADAVALKRALDRYRADGFRVALDDLGAGWSTLNLVHHLRPDFIKLDRELVRQVHRDPVKDLIASKLLEIGRGLGIRTIVEGVEEIEELRWARQRGADYVQGFLIAEPSPRPTLRVLR